MSANIKRWYHWLPWFSALALVLVFAWMLLLDWRSHERNWQQRLEWQQQAQGRYLESVGRDLSQQGMLLAQLVLRDEQVLAQIRAAHRLYVDSHTQDKTELMAQARARLQLQLSDYWSEMKELGVIQLNVFFAPGAVGFVRMQRPQRYGDSLAGLRPLLNQVISSGIPAWGLDVNREGSGYSALLPVFGEQGGAPIAALELTMSSLQLPPETGETIHMAMFLRKTALEPLVWAEVLKKLNRLSHVTLDDWRLERTSSSLVLEWWNQGQMPINRPAQLLRSRTGDYFLLSWWPLTGVAGNSEQPPLAAALWSDVTAEYLAHRAAYRPLLGRWLGLLAGAEALLLLMVWLSRRYLRLLAEEHRQRLQQEVELCEQARQRLALALRSSESGFWEWDIAHDRARFSPEWRQLCGLPADMSDSEDLDEWMSRVHPADKRASYSEMLRHIKGETPMYENEYRLRIADGSYKWILTRGRVVEWGEDGRAALMLGVYSDITQRKEMELIAVRQQAALHSLNEIASLSALDSQEQLRQALALAVRYLGLGVGEICQVVDGRARQLLYYSLRDGQQEDADLPLSHSFSGLLLSAQDVVAEDKLPASALAGHPALERTPCESFIGVPLWQGDKVYGSLCFRARKSRQHDYDRLDKDFVRLLGRWISSVLERWQQDAEIKEILERFQKLSERVPGFLYQFQLCPDGRSFFPYASPGIKSIYGVDASEVTESAARIFDVLHPDDLGWVGETVSYSATHLTPWVATVRVNNPERGLIWTHCQSIPERLEDGSVLWSGYVSDITSIKQTELELAQINSLNKAIFDAASLSIISTDVHGVIKTFNRGAERLLGYSAAEMIDHQTPEIIHLREEVIARAEAWGRELGIHLAPGFDVFVARAREGGVDEHEWIYVRKDGTRVPVWLTVSALRDLEGEIFGYLGIARDISELKRIDKMKAEFISTVSHELRTPLTAISGALGIVAAGAAGAMSDTATRMLQIAHNNSQRLIYLVNDLLDMEKLVAGKMEFQLKLQPLLPLVEQSLEANASYAQQYQVSYQLQPGSHDAQVNVDGLRLEQVLANYLSNAAKFSPPGGQVEVEVRRRFGWVRVSVRDHGRGIPEEFRARIFTKFSQADSSDSRQKGGTGLGLAICKELIERMGGRVGFDSVPEQGAVFYFELPCEDSTRKQSHSSAEPVRQRHCLLLVEPQAEAGQEWVAALEQEGYECDWVPGALAAQEYLALRHYDLVLVNEQLADMDGLELVRQLREQDILGDTGQLRSLLVLSAQPQLARARLPGHLPRQQLYWLARASTRAQLLAAVAAALDEAVAATKPLAY